MRKIERDILLASSAELPWWRRITLGWRLRRDPEGRRLATSLSAVGLLIGPAESPAGRSWWWPVVGTALAACVIVVFVVVRGPWGAVPAERIKVAQETPPPIYRTSGALLLASTLPVAAGSVIGADLDGLELDDPPLPPWSWSLVQETDQ